jgi:hypothetical protein
MESIHKDILGFLTILGIYNDLVNLEMRWLVLSEVLIRKELNAYIHKNMHVCVCACKWVSTYVLCFKKIL